MVLAAVVGSGCEMRDGVSGVARRLICIRVGWVANGLVVGAHATEGRWIWGSVSDIVWGEEYRRNTSSWKVMIRTVSGLEQIGWDLERAIGDAH